MSWVEDNLSDFVQWLGGTPDEDAARRALVLALSSVETWLDRPLESAERVEESFYDSVVRLRAWPVQSVADITVGAMGASGTIAADQVRLDKRNGLLALPGCFQSAIVTYTGGFEDMPADLTFGLFQVAAAFYPAMLSQTMAASGSAIRRVTTPDVGTIEFASTGIADGGTADRLLGATLSPSIEALLQRYRAESVIGAG